MRQLLNFSCLINNCNNYKEMEIMKLTWMLLFWAMAIASSTDLPIGDPDKIPIARDHLIVVASEVKKKG
jgi:hypothetical protein